MPEVIIYTKKICPYCVRAKNLLSNKGITNFTQIDIGANPDKVSEMLEKSGGMRTVPQIFINGTHVGGFDDLNKLNKNGKLDELLG